MGTIADIVMGAARQRQVLPPLADLRLGRLATVHGVVEELDATDGRRHMLPPGEYRVLVHVRPSRPVQVSFLESETARADRAEAILRAITVDLSTVDESVHPLVLSAAIGARIAGGTDEDVDEAIRSAHVAIDNPAPGPTVDDVAQIIQDVMDHRAGIDQQREPGGREREAAAAVLARINNTRRSPKEA